MMTTNAPVGPPICTRLPPSSEMRKPRSEEHTSELQSQSNLVCRLLLEKKKKINRSSKTITVTNTIREISHLPSCTSHDPLHHLTQHVTLIAYYTVTATWTRTFDILSK